MGQACSGEIRAGRVCLQNTHTSVLWLGGAATRLRKSFPTFVVQRARGRALFPELQYKALGIPLHDLRPPPQRSYCLPKVPPAPTLLQVSRAH